MKGLALGLFGKILSNLPVVMLLTFPALVEGQFSYLVTNNTVSIVGYTGSGGSVTIPSDVNGVPVTGIGDNAFLNNTNITAIKIPDSVTNIGQMAFDSCSELRSITCGKGVAQIRPYAFNNCKFVFAVSFKGNAPIVDSTAFNND